MGVSTRRVQWFESLSHGMPVAAVSDGRDDDTAGLGLGPGQSDRRRGSTVGPAGTALRGESKKLKNALDLAPTQQLYFP
jgi:hypothetical protein